MARQLNGIWGNDVGISTYMTRSFNELWGNVGLLTHMTHQFNRIYGKFLLLSALPINIIENVINIWNSYQWTLLTIRTILTIDCDLRPLFDISCII